MNTTSDAGTCNYAVHIQYFSEGEAFASETLLINLPVENDVHAIARDLADRSVYSHPLIPELTRAISIEPIDPDDTDPPPSSPAALKPVCPHCRSDDITRDATARWDPDSRDWSISGLFDCETCGECGAEGDYFARWVPATGMTSAEEFFFEVMDLLGSSILAHNAEFEAFCQEHQGKVKPKDAAELWRARNLSHERGPN
ncbi:MAG: hypothetical protein H6921_14765 [Sphingomonas sp.]|nr:hypothetical protein [Sphingomonas sp.]